MWSAAAPQPGSAGSTRYSRAPRRPGSAAVSTRRPVLQRSPARSRARPTGSRGRRRSRPGGRLRAQHFVGGPGADDRDQRQRDRPPGPRRPRVLRHRQLADRRCGRMQRRGGEPGIVVAARQRGEHGVGVELEQAGVVAYEPPDEGASRQLREVAVLHRPHLARMELQLLRDGVEREAGRLAGSAQQGSSAVGRDPGGRRRRIAFLCTHSSASVPPCPIAMPRGRPTSVDRRQALRAFAARAGLTRRPPFRRARSPCRGVGRPRSTGGRPCGLSLRAPVSLVGLRPWIAMPGSADLGRPAAGPAGFRFARRSHSQPPVLIALVSAESG